MAVFRIFQEMLSNVGRHAQAAGWRCASPPTRACCASACEDDGVGARPRPSRRATAYGVMGMRERARHFGGRIAIASAQGRGSPPSAVAAAAAWLKNASACCIGDDHRIVREGLKQVLADAPEIRDGRAEARRPAPRCSRRAGAAGRARAWTWCCWTSRCRARRPGRAAGAAQGLARAAGADAQHLSRAQYAVRCIKLGAAGYLNKSADADDMIAAVRKVAAGGVYVTPPRPKRWPPRWGAPRQGTAPRRCRTASTRCSGCSRRGAA
jgi:hypothetical protein